MIRPIWLVLATIFAALSLTVVISRHKMVHANARLRAAQEELLALSSNAKEIIDLRSRQQRIELAQRPAQDVIAHVNTVLTELAMPSTRFKSLTPESDAAAGPPSSRPGGGGYRRQSLRLTLGEMSVDEIGGFLLQWRQSQPIWTPTRIELTHVRNSQEGSIGNRYDATILISAIYVVDSSGT